MSVSPEDFSLSNKDPVALFKAWLELARQSEVNDAEAMCLATCNAQGRPSARMVLLKDITEQGFKFHTNADSRKGDDLEENPYVALCFHWKTLRKQVRIEGKASLVSEKEADDYFATRPYDRQIGAWASQQSRPLESRAFLEEKIAHYKNIYPQSSPQPVPRPAYWKGYCVYPLAIEFWFDNPDRLHDRFLFTRSQKDEWEITRLYP